MHRNMTGLDSLHVKQVYILWDKPLVKKKKKVNASGRVLCPVQQSFMNICLF